MGIGLFGGAGGGLTGPAANGGTPAWTMVTPAQWAAATEIYSLSGALTVEPSDDPAWTFKTSFDDTGSDSGIFELALDMTPYIYNDRCTVLLEFGPRPNASAWENVFVGIRAGGENDVVTGGSGPNAIGQPRTRIYFAKVNTTTNGYAWVSSSNYSDQAWFTGMAVDIHVGNATESPTAWTRAMGSATTDNAVWPAWLDPNNPRAGDFVGINQYWSPSAARSASFRVDTPRTPATAERKLIVRPSATNAGSAWSDWYHRVCLVNP